MSSRANEVLELESWRRKTSSAWISSTILISLIFTTTEEIIYSSQWSLIKSRREIKLENSQDSRKDVWVELKSIKSQCLIFHALFSTNSQAKRTNEKLTKFICFLIVNFLLCIPFVFWWNVPRKILNFTYSVLPSIYRMWNMNATRICVNSSQQHRLNSSVHKFNQKNKTMQKRRAGKVKGERKLK